VKSLTA